MSIQEAYREYRTGSFRVNRRYQRKLVWTLDEKRALIDSVLHDYPIPLILLAYKTDEDGSKTFEILDGMQRLNALFNFIENEFDLNGKYFDVAQLARARQLSEEGAFVAAEDPDLLLAPEECSNILDYTLAVTEFPATDDGAVREVFGRINSYGRQLSSQEKRQAGVVSGFSSIVRELAAEVRGDVSQDSLDLSEMPAISVDVAGEAPSYGVKAEDTFWCKQGILRRAQLRDSEDEQMIADLAISILEDDPFAFSGKKLDDYYNTTSAEGMKIEALLATYGVSRLKANLLGTLSVLRETIETVNPAANALSHTVHPAGGSNPIKTAFYAVYMAFFSLCVRRRMSPADGTAIMTNLAGLQDSLQVSAGQIRSEPRRQNIRITIGLIQDSFEDKEPPALLHDEGGSMSFENTLRRSRIETSAYECKQGLLRLDGSRQKEPELLDRIAKTLCGIANISPEREGALFIGVADNEADKNRIETLDCIAASYVGARFVVGVDRELQHMGLDLEGYKRSIVDHISTSGLSEPLRSSILSEIDCISYRGHSEICIWVPSQPSYSTLSDRVFFRKGSSTEEAEAMDAIFSRFRR
jgi:Protein of unknown function DUF262